MKLTTVVLVAAVLCGVHEANGSALRQRVLAKASEQASATACLIGGHCPSGSYLNSCTGCYTDTNGVLSCQFCNGVASTYSIYNSWACENNINLLNNQLQCQFPLGSYYLTSVSNQGQCSECYMGSYSNLNSMTCVCQRFVGDTSPVVSTLNDASSCFYVTNSNGVLTCNSGTVPTSGSSTPAPTATTPAPTTTSSVCSFTETTPSSTCASKAQGNGCAQYNYCCFNAAANPVCAPPPNCPECPTLSVGQCLVGNNANCCTVVNGACTRNCNAQSSCPVPFVPGS